MLSDAYRNFVIVNYQAYAWAGISVIYLVALLVISVLFTATFIVAYSIHKQG